MPLDPLPIDTRTYQQLRDEALARIPVHTPEWTNFNRSDPGVTIVELFAFMAETLLYRANQIPERNRRKFLQLLRVPLRAATPASGMVAFANERGPRETMTLGAGTELRAGPVPFRVETGLDVLPIETQVFFKREILDSDPALRDYYKQLYASFRGQPATKEPRLYETVPFPARDGSAVDIGRMAVDSSLWVALLLRQDVPPSDQARDDARKLIENRVLSLGVVPAGGEEGRRLAPGAAAGGGPAVEASYLMPDVRDLTDGKLPVALAERIPRYQRLTVISDFDYATDPGIVQIPLPDQKGLKLWTNIDPLEAGADQFPPSLEDTRLGERVITWLQIQFSPGASVSLQWAGGNAALVSQRVRVIGETLPRGNGQPDQTVRLVRRPVIRDSVQVTVDGTAWRRVDDLLSAPGEAAPRAATGAMSKPIYRREDSYVFELDEESGEIRFGDGMHGARPPDGASILADYDYSIGSGGSVAAGAINAGPGLPAGVTVTNPVATWGGSDEETVADGERQITRYLQHRDRLVTREDFEAITWRTPGVELGRVDVLPAFNPELIPSQPGDAPGAVTIMIVPQRDPAAPDAPSPDARLRNAVCDYIDPRRLVTTEVFVRGPHYRAIWVTIGIEVVSGRSIAEVREAVKATLRQFLSPLPPADGGDGGPLAHRTSQQGPSGWPLGKAVVALELAAVASRVEGVLLVRGVNLAEGTSGRTDAIEMSGLDLPQLMNIGVGVGDPADLDSLRSVAPDEPPAEALARGGFVPVPAVPEEC